MSLQNYESTRGTTNLARVARMILGPCTDVLCALLTKEVTPSALMHNVNTFIANHPKHKPCLINKDQQKLVWGGNYSEFDITLLYTLLRNVSTFPPPSNDWGKDPDKNDRSVSANIERIRLERNQYGHKSDISLTDTAFNKKCQDIFTIVQELEGYLGADTIYQDAVAFIKTCSMDPEQEAKYINQLHDVAIKLDYVIEEVQKSKTTSVPHSVRVLYDRDISRWTAEDSVFLETHNFPVMLDQVRKQPFVTFVGVPGSGKTATVRHIALTLQKEGYEILPIKEINKIEDYCNKNIPQVFVIDDVLGVFGLNDNDRNTIEKFSERLKDPLNTETKTLMTCRETVFRNKDLLHFLLTKHENVICLQSQENALNEDDKQNILKKHKLNGDLLGPTDFALSSNMFPLLCKLFSREKEFEVYGPTFFISPVPCIIEEVNSLETRNKHQYASLVLLMANENKLSEKMLDDANNETRKTIKDTLFTEMKRDILGKCRVPSTDSFYLSDALSEMEGTYTKKSGNEFTFIHDFMFEIIAYHFGCRFPNLILKYASSNYIANYIKINQNDSKKRENDIECEEEIASEDSKFSIKNNKKGDTIDLCIQLHESQYPIFAKRLLKDVHNGQFYNVFRSEALKNQSVLQAFLAELEKMSYDDLYHLLLSEIEDSKTCLWNYNPKNVDSEYTKLLSFKEHAHMCLMNQRLWPPFRRTVRGISWIIFFGHHSIMKHIISQMIWKKGNVNDLFLNSFNKRFKPVSNMGQDVTEEVWSLNHSMIDESFQKPDNIGKDHKTEIYKDSETDACTDSYTTVDEDGHSSVDKYNEPVLIEQCRLLCLGCFSGNLDTVQILLKHVNTDTLNNKVWYSTMFLFYLSPLGIACEYGYLDIVMKLLEAGADMNDKRFPPLVVACEHGQTSIVRALLKVGADVNQGNCVFTPLQIACKEEVIILVEELINAGADVNLNVPLFNACIKGNACIVQKLIKARADVNCLKYGVSPLLAACINGHFNVVKELITAGADVNTNVMKKDEDKFPALKGFFQGLKKMFQAEQRLCNKYDQLIPQGMNIMMEDVTPLIAACDCGYFKILKFLMRLGAKVDPNDNNKTTLYFPSYWYHLNIVKRLTEMESNVDLACNNTKERSFIVVCESGQLEVVQQMIRGGVDINMKDRNKTPLIVACYKNHLHVVKELIEAGADINLGNEFILPLQVASYEGHLHIVKELNKGKIGGNRIHGTGKALVSACFFGHLSVVKELIASHIDVNQNYGKETPLTTASFMGYFNILKELINAGANVNLNNDSGRTPLTLACYRGHINIVRELIQGGADVNQSNEKEIPLSLACEGGYMDMVTELIKAGANVNQSNGKEIPLILACEGGHMFMASKLLKAGANVNQSNGKKTPLTAACKKGHLNEVQTLIEAGADVNQNDGNKTPLTAACENGLLKVRIVQELIKAGANVNQNDGNKTPLTAACKQRHDDVHLVLELIKAGADVNQSDGRKTPLLATCERGHRQVVKELIKAGADFKQSGGNKTPLTAACEKGHWEVITELIIANADID